MDTSDINASMERLNQKHHDFSKDFLLRILGLDGVDTAVWGNAIKQFHRDYSPIFSATQKLEPAIEE